MSLTGLLWGNVVVLPPRAAVQPQPAIFGRALANWGGTIVSIFGSVASLLALFITPPLFKDPPPFNYTLVVFIIFFAIASISIRDQYRRWRLYQRAAYYLHTLAHKLRDRLDIKLVNSLQSQPYIISIRQPTKSPLNRLLYDTLNDVCDLFRNLVHTGSVAVNILIPIPIQPNTEPTHLVVGLWSRPYDSLLGARRARDEKGEIFRSKIAINASVGGLVFRSRKSVLVRDTKSIWGSMPFDLDEERTRGKETYKYVRSLINVPIVLHNHPLFVLSIDCSKRRQFHPDYVEIARMCADILAIVFKLGNVNPENSLNLRN